MYAVTVIVHEPVYEMVPLFMRLCVTFLHLGHFCFSDFLNIQKYFDQGAHLFEGLQSIAFYYLTVQHDLCCVSDMA